MCLIQYQITAGSPVASGTTCEGNDFADPWAIRSALHSATSASKTSSVAASLAGIERTKAITTSRPKTSPNRPTRASAPAKVRFASTSPLPAPPLSAANDTSG